MRWQSHHIITTSSLYSYVGDQYQTDGHIMIHVHLFGDPGETHIHSSLARISLNAHKIQFGILSKPLFPSFTSSFCVTESSMLLPCHAVFRLFKRLMALSIDSSAGVIFAS